ncbi:unnamed protein product [Sphagnum jensenii]|uniref:EamA domain-containing protein n=1 Tax=Sphagnum jensenii TaxID=128206 RepID=A0ABP0VN13_9BRYO
MECIGTGSDVECVVPLTDRESKVVGKFAGRAMKTSGWSGDMASSSDRGQTILDNKNNPEGVVQVSVIDMVLETLLLISPFFFWGTAMVAMKGVLPKAGPLFVASFRLIPAGTLLIAFASSRGRKMPVGTSAWLAIALFGLIDASCFQGFLTEGLRKTSAGLGSVIIDSQPLTVAVLAALLFGETLGPIAISGLGLGIVGLILLEVHSVIVLGKSEVGQWTLWDSGEWWMLLAAQSMAVGTVMVRWVCQYSDPIMATGWHMVLGGLPLLALSVWQQDPALSGHIQDLNINDWGALFYSSLFGSAISYGVFFYNATRGSLTKLSSLTFLTPMFATLFGYLVLDEMLSGVQLAGAVVTLVGIYMVNLKIGSETQDKVD